MWSREVPAATKCSMRFVPRLRGAFLDGEGAVTTESNKRGDGEPRTAGGGQVRLGPNQLALLQTLRKLPGMRAASMKSLILHAPVTGGETSSSQSIHSMYKHGWITMKPTGTRIGCGLTSMGRAIAEGRLEIRIIGTSNLLRRAREAEREIERIRREAALYGTEDEVRDVAALCERFGERIPPGFLAHATKFECAPLETIATLLGSWIYGGVKSPPGGAIGSADMRFLKWVALGREQEVMKLLKSRPHTSYRRAYKRLVVLARSAKKALGQFRAPQLAGAAWRAEKRWLAKLDSPNE